MITIALVYMQVDLLYRTTQNLLVIVSALRLALLVIMLYNLSCMMLIKVFHLALIFERDSHTQREPKFLG